MIIEFILLRVGETMEEKIVYTRRLLDKLVSTDDANLSEGRILEVSKQLDILIVAYYEKVSF